MISVPKEGLEMIVTGGAGFIGSNFLRHMTRKYPNYRFTNVDKLTYAGNSENVAGLTKLSNYASMLGADICDSQRMLEVIQPGSVVVNFAAESHVDNSLKDSMPFLMTNTIGTEVLLAAAREKKARLFVQISTDEVYGSLSFEDPSSKEEDTYRTSSPYSASKAAAELLCNAAIETHKQQIIITRSSNNYGPYQYPEKVIPLFVTNLMEGKKVPLYGDGKNVRDWLYVQDNCEAIDFLIHHGQPGEKYNIGGGNEVSNIDLTHRILKIMGKDESSIEQVTDRPGHDRRYSLDCSKIHKLGWVPQFDFNVGLRETVEWYKRNEGWWMPLKKRKEQSK